MPVNNFKIKKILTYLIACPLVMLMQINHTGYSLAQTAPNINNQTGATQDLNLVDIKDPVLPTGLPDIIEASTPERTVHYYLQLGYSWAGYRQHPMAQFTGNNAYSSSRGDSYFTWGKLGLTVDLDIKYFSILKALGLALEVYHFANDNKGMFKNKPPAGIDDLQYSFTNFLLNIDLFWFENFSRNSLPIKVYTGFGLGYTIGLIKNKTPGANFSAYTHSLPLYGELGFILMVKYVGLKFSAKATHFFTFKTNNSRYNFAKDNFISANINAALILIF